MEVVEMRGSFLTGRMGETAGAAILNNSAD